MKINLNLCRELHQNPLKKSLEVQKQLFTFAMVQIHRKIPVTEYFYNNVAEVKPVITAGLYHRCFPLKRHFLRTP